MQEDVDVLKKNQMQLANTIQVLHQQNVTLQQELARQAERLDSVIQSLSGQQIELDEEVRKYQMAAFLLPAPHLFTALVLFKSNRSHLPSSFATFCVFV